MLRAPVSSRAIASVGFDAELNVLEVVFKAGGTYQYFAVPRAVMTELLAAPSLGAFVAQQIVPVFRGHKVR